MSFGFLDEELVISKAITKAILDRDNAILLFAAAANFGAKEKEMFPARHDYVISVRGTNIEGTFQEFNPPPRRDGPAVYGTLGKVVPSAGLCSHDEEVCKSGTSVATPIAAGIAAMLLGYAEFGCHKGKLQEYISRKLRTRDGMRAMFDYMSVYMGEKRFYICPRKFLGIGEPEQWAAMTTAVSNA